MTQSGGYPPVSPGETARSPPFVDRRRWVGRDHGIIRSGPSRGLGKQFAPGVGVEGIDLDIEPGTIFGFIGPSGSGKTTTIRLLTGVTAPDTGEVTVMGKSPAAFSREDRARIGYMPQLSVLYNQLTIWQNMTFAASIFGMPR